MEAIALEVSKWAFRSVYRQLMKVGAAETAELRVQIGEEATLEQGVFRKIDAGNNVAGAKGNLLGFRKEIVGIAVQNEFADHLERNFFFRNNFGGIENIEFKIVRGFLVKNLESQFVFRKIAGGDS